MKRRINNVMNQRAHTRRLTAHSIHNIMLLLLLHFGPSYYTWIASREYQVLGRSIESYHSELACSEGKKIISCPRTLCQW